VRAIRYYEQEGLVPTTQRQGGKRIYDPSVLHRLAVIEPDRTASRVTR